MWLPTIRIEKTATPVRNYITWFYSPIRLLFYAMYFIWSVLSTHFHEIHFRESWKRKSKSVHLKVRKGKGARIQVKRKWIYFFRTIYLVHLKNQRAIFSYGFIRFSRYKVLWLIIKLQQQMPDFVWTTHINTKFIYLIWTVNPVLQTLNVISHFTTNRHVLDEKKKKKTKRTQKTHSLESSAFLNGIIRIAIFFPIYLHYSLFY